MLRTVLAAVVLALLAACSWARQQNAATDQGAQQSPVIARSTNSTAEDQGVPLCPAKLGNQAETTGTAVKDNAGVTPPKVIQSVKSKFTDQARQAFKKKHLRAFDDAVLIGLIVDEQGDPQNLCLQKSLGYGLDANAAKDLQQYKFAPATKDGKPISVRITVEVRYRLY